MSHAELCPGCKGRKYIHRFGFVGNIDITSSLEMKCGICKGEGYLVVLDDINYEVLQTTEEGTIFILETGDYFASYYIRS